MKIKLATQEQLENVKSETFENILKKQDKLTAGDNIDITGATFTGKVSSPIVSATRYFETPTLVGEGDDSTYYHRVVFGHKNFDKMEFHEYGGLFRFLENKKGGVNDGRLLFQISTSGVNSDVDLKERGVRVYSPNNKPTAADLGITDTVTTINGKTGVISKADITALGIPSQDTVYKKPTSEPISYIQGLQAELDSKVESYGTNPVLNITVINAGGSTTGIPNNTLILELE